MPADGRGGEGPSDAAVGTRAGGTAGSGISAPRAIVDLSPSLTEDYPVRALGEKLIADFGYRPRTRFEPIVQHEPFYVADAYITLFNHVGPHHDPPSHMIQGAASTDQIPLERFVGPARLLDFRDFPRDEPIGPDDLEPWGIQPGEIVIVATGYTPPQGPAELPSYPYLSGEAAEYLARLPVKAFASDMPSLGSIKRYYELRERGVRGVQGNRPEHYAFLSRGIPNIEGLVNLEALIGESEMLFVGAPLKIADGNGAPMRAMAFLY